MPSKDINILVVDDFATMRRIITNVLKQLGYENIQEAEDGNIALGMMESGKFDFVITDWNMPQMSGLDLLKAIRANPESKSTPVLMVTAEAQQENIMAAAQAGVNNYIIKPFDAQTLAGKIDKIFAA